MKFLHFMIIVNVPAVVGVIGFVIWQFFDQGFGKHGHVMEIKKRVGK